MAVTRMETGKFWPFFMLIWPLLWSVQGATAASVDKANLVAGKWVTCPNSVSLHVLCYQGQEPSLAKMFQSTFVELKGPAGAGWSVYLGNSAAEVEASYKGQQSVWSWFSSQSQGPTEVQMTPFNSSCIGVSSQKSAVEARLVLLHISYYRLATCLAGIFLLFLAPKLARSKICHYFTGVSFGMLASALIVSILLWRIFPKKGLAMSLMVGGWMVGVYFLGLAYENARQIMNEYRGHVAAYILVTGLISFFAVHRFGPVSNPRTLDCIQWTLQIIAGVLILLSSHFLEGSVAVLFLSLAIYNFPARWSATVTTFIRRKIFRPQHKFISPEEYEAQGASETEKALKELREFCSSPQSNPWKLQLSLSNPQRFARFVEGESHLENDEILQYNTISWDEEDVLTEDEDY
ncbi:nuclear envelope integral membrane protein [Neocloeon triangulifer]|uniref:nuclear envelope integral membrane protein n=1 Tax=Neocloeon triangulifer TaxID=2078957 RepID=UPI00286F40B9|nr:nuclear envelope integral membrane protein [Neocloeon triangulifer]